MRVVKPLVAVGVVVGVLAAVLVRWSATVPDPAPTDSDKRAECFVDRADAAGVRFRHFDARTDAHSIAETIGSGIGWIDYDADGHIDLLCLQDCPLVATDEVAGPQTHRLYRNRGDGSFDDVTERVGLNRSGFGMGCAVGDFNNDGFDDLAITYLGRIEVWQNVSDGAGGRLFRDATASLGLSGANPHWGSSCAWGDLDNDGWLDLYVCNYVELDRLNPITCRDERTRRNFVCSPTLYPHVAHKLFRNNKGTAFQDVSQDAGLDAPSPGAGLAVVLVDLDGDGRLDVFAANDMKAAHLYRNRTTEPGRIVLEECAGLSGAAYGSNGATISGMCAEAAEIDGTGRPSLFVTNYQSLPNILFRNRGGFRFVEEGMASGLGLPSRSRLGFGAVFLDYDRDGVLDLAVANGHVHRDAADLHGVPYAQAAQLFHGEGDGRFRVADPDAGGDFIRQRVGRGLARGDYDNDGRPDLALSGVGEPLALLRNQVENANDWIGLDLRGDGRASNRNAIGAVVTITAGSRTQTHFVTGGGSYLSASDQRLTIGLGILPEATANVRVRWPSGRVQDFPALQTRRYWTMDEGQPAAKPKTAS